MSEQQYLPLLFCFAGPGGSGKSTVCRKILEADPSLFMSISTTTRQPRAGEEEGVHYYFVSKNEFEDRISRGQFLEHALFGENRYGTERTNVEHAAAHRNDVLLDIDVQGVEQVRTLYPQQTVVIFVFPPQFSELEERMRRRGAESEEKIAMRMEIAEQEIARLRQPTFSDYLLINDSLGDAVQSAQTIIAAERMRIWRRSESELDAILRG